MSRRFLLRLKSSCTERGIMRRWMPWMTPSGRITSSGLRISAESTVLAPVGFVVRWRRWLERVWWWR
ncbi:hypothetical protein MtrunA17_Chr7g0267831 [Medicago truncatula]|uniref:Uncharacterized protein n=1 Tax=Medicago truncatula TaxID=3880 RepID=A0A396H6B9_MEDTR|nr:hypothetical protein MtrunA17_Chr7g0267831 [Medicago truncatula]